MNDYQQLFIDNLNRAALKNSRAKIFDDFLRISTAALNRDEEIFTQMPDKELHAELLAILAAAINYSIAEKVLHDNRLGLNYKFRWADYDARPKYRDIIGEIFTALELNDSDHGQVFTPQPVADTIGHGRFIKIYDKNIKLPKSSDDQCKNIFHR